jgi:carbamoyl-phosphate synthase large subunit
MKEWISTSDIMERLEKVGDDRIFRLKDALRLGVSERSIHKLTLIDPWFIKQIKNLVKAEERLQRYNVAEDIPADFLRELKQMGYSDAQIAWLMRINEHEVTRQRYRQNIRRTYKMVDTCAAEFEAQTPYFYSSFDQENESQPTTNKKIIVLGSGPNRIGQGIEFDYCCVHGVLAIREVGYEAIMINCNPETVSTDFDIANKLYFEPVYWEHIREIIELEKPEGIIVQLGGQTALKLAEEFYKNDIPIIGTAFPDMDIAEDRGRFSDLLKELDIPYPRYGVAHDVDDAIRIANQVGYPVLVRPSYVLGGQRMKIVINDHDLERQVLSIFKHMPDNKVLIDQFLERAKEAEIDAICDGEDLHVMGIMEHVEPAGIHSGDSSAVLPPYSLSQSAIDQMIAYARKIAFALKIKGLINIQFAIRTARGTTEEKVYVIEANPRASRTTPFIAKAYKIPYLNIATKVMMGTHKLSDFEFHKQLKGYAIKVPVFSFEKFPHVDIRLGPEMKSTGEAIQFIDDLTDPFFRELDRNRNMYLFE